MTEAVLDASAVLAFLGDEPGANFVRPWLRGGLISSVNAGEVLYRRYRPGHSLEEIIRVFRSLELRVVDFNFDHAAIVASLEPYARVLNLSFADRACLSLGISTPGIPVLTADHDWAKLNLGLDLRFIREKKGS